MFVRGPSTPRSVVLLLLLSLYVWVRDGKCDRQVKRQLDLGDYQVCVQPRQTIQMIDQILLVMLRACRLLYLLCILPIITQQPLSTL